MLLSQFTSTARAASVAAVLLAAHCAFAANPSRLTVKGSPDNDLLRVLNSSGVPVQRFDSSREAIRRAPRGSGVLILSDGYPNRTEAIPQALFDVAAAKMLRLYIEFPSFIPGVAVGPPRAVQHERAVVSSTAFGAELPQSRILGIHDCRFVPVIAPHPDIVLARIAGFDRAVYGLPSRGVFPILFVTSNGRTMIATTKLSQFITGRYEPVDAWSPIWTRIIEWAAGAQSIPALRWTPDVHPAYASTSRLPAGAETRCSHSKWRRGFSDHECWSIRDGATNSTTPRRFPIASRRRHRSIFRRETDAPAYSKGSHR